MSYQEALLPIKYLAEAAGVKKAVQEYADCYELPGYCSYIRTVHHCFGGELYACIGGDGDMVDSIARHYSYRCYVTSYDSERCETLHGILIERAAKQRPDYVKAAYRRTKQAFETELDKYRKKKKELKKETDELWPEIVEMLNGFGPSTAAAFVAMPVFDNRPILDVLANLERQGLIESIDSEYKDEFELTEKAKIECGIEPAQLPQTPEEKLDVVLRKLGSLSSSQVAAFLNVSVSKANKILKEQVELGRIVKDDRRKPYRYYLRGENAAEPLVSQEADDFVGDLVW